MKKTFLSVAILAMMTLLLVSANKKPVTLYLIGDATVAENSELDTKPERGWGQVLPSYVVGNVVIENLSKPEQSTKSVLLDGTWTDLLGRLHRKDIVLIELAHSDENHLSANHFSTIDIYEDHLMQMVKDVQKKNATVVLVTPVARRFYYEGEMRPRHGAYPDAVRRVAKRMKVEVVDLTESSEKWLSEVGVDGSAAYYAVDNTQLTEDGALLISRMVVEKMMSMKAMKGLFSIPENVEVKYTNAVTAE